MIVVEEYREATAVRPRDGPVAILLEPRDMDDGSILPVSVCLDDSLDVFAVLDQNFLRRYLISVLLVIRYEECLDVLKSITTTYAVAEYQHE